MNKAQSEAPSVEEILARLAEQVADVFDGDLEDYPQTKLINEATSKINRLIVEAEVKGMKKMNDRFAGLYGIGGDGNDHVTTYRKVYFDNVQEILALSNNLSNGDV